jgi:hypothetical protein
MRLFTALLFASLMFGQATLTLTGPATARIGSSITVNLTLANPPASLAAMQWDATLPAGVTATSVTGGASNTAAKTLYCNATSTRCLTVGINANLYAAGVVATYSLTLPASAAPGSVSIPLGGLVGATLQGDAAALTAGPAYSFTVLARTDLNGDGKTDVLDLQLMIQEILSGSPPLNDQNGDSVGNIRDAQLIARAALGS